MNKTTMTKPLTATRAAARAFNGPSMLQANLGTTEGERKKTAHALYTALSNSYLLLVKTQNHHWNVTGAHFGPLHQLFESHYQDLFAGVDDLAERIRTLGFPVAGGLEAFKKAGSVEETPGAMHYTDMIQDLIRGQEVVIASLRTVAKVAADVEDIESEDLAIERLRAHEKQLWMLASHL